MKKVIVLFSLLLANFSAQATVLKDEKNIDWASKRDLTSSQFSTEFNRYSNRGMMLIDIDAYKVGNGLRYSMVWRENTDNRRWAAHRNLTSSSYSQLWNTYRTAGYRPLDIAAYQSGNTTLYAGIWVENTENIGWSSYRNLSGTRYGEIFSDRVAAGYRLVDMEAYQTSNGLRYSAIWYRNTDNRGWAQLRGMTRETYQDEVNKRSAKGYMVVDFESYKMGAQRRYAAIWEKKPGYARQVRTNRNATGYANLWREYRDKGYRLIDFERDGNNYSGIWVENNTTRYRYSRKSQLDEAMEDYLDDNNLPGISVAIIKDGSTIYRRGFGFADRGAGKVAHSETVYNAASVSKVIGGTLAVKLEETLTLADGRRFGLDLADPTANYIDNLPRHHRHTLEELASHIACIPHYSTTPGIPNQTNHYNNATDAVENIWNTGLLTGCTRGSTRSYSTPAFTFLAAALEGATGRGINRLFEEELFGPHNLNMRVQFAAADLPYNYERAKPYNNANMATNYRDNSWKVIGGGIETSANQLARFGWKVLDGQIVGDIARDNTLWQRVNGNTSNGIGWAINTRNGRRVAEHGGSWTGARSNLRVYRDDGLVIAIMSNRTNHTVDDLGTLTERLANIVL